MSELLGVGMFCIAMGIINMICGFHDSNNRMLIVGIFTLLIGSVTLGLS